MKNIQKITSAMKMVAASKMRVAQSLTERSRGLVQPFVSLIGDHPGGQCSRAARIGACLSALFWMLSHDKAAGADVEHNVTVAVTSDKGLCGGINTTVTKYTRGTLATIKEGVQHAFHSSQSGPLQACHVSMHEKLPGCKSYQACTRADSSKQASIIVMGEKGRAQLGRYERNSIHSTIADTNKVAITFSQVRHGSSGCRSARETAQAAC